MVDQDFFADLGMPRAVTRDEIKHASRRLTREYRPDVASGAGAAYEVVRDPEKHKPYDHHGAALGRRQPPDPRLGWNGGYYSRRIFFESATQQRGGLGLQQAQNTCDLADILAGADKILSLHVPQLDQRGHVVLLDERLKTHILKEAMPGQRLVPKGKGGDVILEIYVRPLPTYGIDGSDLIADLPVTAREAALGASLDMPTLDRRVRLRVPAHARAGQKLSLKGRGHPVRRHVNLYAFLSIVNPSIKTKEGRALYEQMAREMPFDPLSEMKG